jgi:carbamate kinase
MRIVVALGGNALLHRGDRPDAAIQESRLADAAPALSRLASENDVVFVHGNGPQVGLLATESSRDDSLSRSYPLGDLVAETQGLIGFWLQQALTNAGLTKPIVTLVSQTVVDPHDAAMENPTKFVGSVYSESAGRALAKKHGWAMALDGSAWRRVVASPKPIKVVEEPIAVTLLEAGVSVILAGGGGVPVAVNGTTYQALEAVVDKDAVAALIATNIHADMLLILTDVAGVMSDWGTPNQKLIRKASPHDLLSLHLPAGSMGPKVDAACAFVDAVGGIAAIGSLDRVETVVSGAEGTRIVRG